MRIERLTMMNFGPFHGTHDLTFPGEGHGVHLIRGNNGQGKTSIQRAVLWCFYGRIIDRQGEDVQWTSLLNWTARDDGIFQFAVKVNFNHEGTRWVVTRKTTSQSHKERAYHEGMDFFATRDDEVVPNPQHVLQRMLPADVSRFFFFDGEMLGDYEELLGETDTDTGLLRESIERVLGIPVLRLARNDLREVERKVERERGRLVRRLGGRPFEELDVEFEQIGARIQARELGIKELEKQVATLESEIATKKRRMAELAAVSALASERLGIEKDIDIVKEKQVRENENSHRLVSDLYKAILWEASEGILVRLEQKHESTMAKYNEKQQLIGRQKELEKAVAAARCRTCGAVLDAPKLTAISAEMGEVAIEIQALTEVPEPNLEFDTHANRLRKLKDQVIVRDKLEAIEARLPALEVELARLKGSLEEKEAKLRGVDDEEPKRIEMEIQRGSKEIGKLLERKRQQEAEMRGDQDKKSALDQKIRGINRDEVAELDQRLETIRTIGGVLEQAVSTFRDLKRTHVGGVASKIFRELRTKESFARLEINDTYGLNIVTDRGNVLNRAEWRSSGEQQIVALAMVGALNRCAEVKAPVLMDTPFGRLDTHHGAKVLGFLPTLSEQVVLLVTDREFRPGDEQFLEGHIKSDRTVVHKGEVEGSFIGETRA